jgi:hypothetical protein
VKRYDLGRIGAGCLIAALLAVLSPFSVALSSVVFVPTVFIAFLYAWSGAIPASFLSVGTVGAFYMLGNAYGGFGWVAAGIALLSIVLPAWCSVVLLNKRPPFFRGLRLSIALQAAASLLSMAVLWLGTRTDLADLFVSILSNFYERQAPETLQMMSAMFTQMGLNITSETIPLLIEELGVSLRASLATMIVCSSVITGIFSYAWPCYIRLRRGDEPPVDMKLLGEWRLPKNMIVGLPACVIACLILYRMGVSGADSAYNAVLNLAVLAFDVQAVGAISRLLKKNGAPRGRRILLITLALLFLRYFLPFLGLYSALFGSQGLISEFLRKKADENHRGDE